MDNTIKYSVVVPVYNSEGSLSALCTGIMNGLHPFSFEIILVDDGSRDRSWEVIKEIKKDHPGKIRAVQLQKNYGQHAATTCGFAVSTGEFVVTIDDDLQYDPADILKLINAQQETDADVVYGTSDQRQQPGMKNAGEKFAQIVERVVEGSEQKGTSFRLIKKNITDQLTGRHSNSFIAIDNVLRWYTNSIEFVRVDHKRRSAGRSGYSMRKLAGYYLGTITSYSVVPLKAMTYLGFLFSILFFLVGLKFVLAKLTGSVPLGYTSIIVTILFCSSLILFSLGVIGQYLFISFMAHQNKPSYSIKRVI